MLGPGQRLGLISPSCISESAASVGLQSKLMPAIAVADPPTSQENFLPLIKRGHEER